MEQKKIEKRQNEELSLACQFVARHYYNRAELFNYIIWGLCIVSVLTIFIPDTTNWIILGIPLFLNIIVLVLEKIFGDSVSIAAKLRNYFDSYVLNIGMSKYSESDVRYIKETVSKVIEHYPEDYAVQIKNTGSEIPPGVRNWYEFSRDYSDTEVKYECQRLNCWWNNEMTKQRIVCYIFVFVVLGILLVLGIILDWEKSILRIILCSGIIFKTFERIVANFKYRKVSLQIEGASKILDGCQNEANIMALQELIEARREISVLEINAIHKRIAKKLSERYRKIA